jgi:flavin reductase (DIM6/NTAB) family NADH-FMN oxidoreductase RutF
MKEAGLEAAPSTLVKPPRVKASPCAMECKWLQTVRVDDLEGHPTQRYVVFGQVVGVYIDERFIKDGLLDTAAMYPIARAGYDDYFVSTAETRFSLRRPKGPALITQTASRLPRNGIYLKRPQTTKET